jgi:plastocyanin
MTRRLAILGLCLAGPACMGLQARASGPQVRTVSISNFAFAPAELTLLPGDTVVWTNDDAFRHTASADSGAWSSPELRTGERFRFVATRPGRFPYHCSAHPVMRATLIVRPRD